MERREEVFLNQSFYKMLINWIKGKAPNSLAEVVIKVGLIEANETGIVSIKWGSHLTRKIAKKFSLIEVAWVALKKHAVRNQFFYGSDDYVLCYSNQSFVQFIPGTNVELPVEKYKEEIGKPCSTQIYICVM